MNQSILYVSYIEDSLKTLTKIYNEIFQYAHLSTVINNESLENKSQTNDIINSTQSIQSWVSALDRRTRILENYLGNSSIPSFDYTIEQELWRTYMYVETTEVSFVQMNLNVEFVFYPQYPEQGKYMLLIKEKGITFTLVYDETNNATRSIEIVKGVRLFFSEEILSIIKNADSKIGKIDIYAPPYFKNTFLRVRLPFHPLKLYLNHIGWVRSVLDGLDAHILQLRLGLLYNISSQSQNLQTSYAISSFRPETPLKAIKPNEESELSEVSKTTTSHFMYY